MSKQSKLPLKLSGDDTDDVRKALNEKEIKKQIIGTLLRLNVIDNALFKKIKTCEEMIINKEDYQTLLDEIILLLNPHFSSPSKQYQKLFKKMKKKTPNVFALIRQYLK